MRPAVTRLVNMANPIINTGTSVTGVSRGESRVNRRDNDSAAVNNDSGGDAADHFKLGEYKPA